jgi:hypothetical protein
METTHFINDSDEFARPTFTTLEYLAAAAIMTDPTPPEDAYMGTTWRWPYTGRPPDRHKDMEEDEDEDD